MNAVFFAPLTQIANDLRISLVPRTAAAHAMVTALHMGQQRHGATEIS